MVGYPWPFADVAAVRLGSSHLALLGRRDRRWAVIPTTVGELLNGPLAHHPEPASALAELGFAAIARDLLASGVLSKPESVRDVVRTRSVPSLLVKMTGACNIACTYCYDYHHERWRGKLDLELVKRTIRGLFAQRRELALIFHGGEPLLNRPQISDLVAYCEALTAAEGGRIGYSIQTNGTLFDDDSIEFLLAHDFDIGVSLDGPREVNDRSRRDHRGRGVFDVVMTAFERYPEFMTQRVGFLAVVQDDVDEIAAVHAFFERLGVATLKLMPVHSGGRQASAGGAEPEAQGLDRFLVGQLSKIQRGDAGRPYLLNVIELVDRFLDARETNICMSATCGAGREFLVIDADNNIRACDINYSDKLILSRRGEHDDQPDFGRRSDNARLLAARHAWVHEAAPCSHCEWLAFCGGSCAGKALAREGHLLALDPDECRTRKTLFPLILRYLSEPGSGLLAYYNARRAHRKGRSAVVASQVSSVGALA